MLGLDSLDPGVLVFLALAGLAACYADAIDAAGLGFDLLFGPAYKGIPLATALACEYARRGRDLPLAYNRKEAKAHGEGGTLVGAALAGRRVLVVDDVLTAGTAVRQEFPVDADSIALFGRTGADVSTTNTWAMEVEPGSRFLYELSRPGGRMFQVEFDLATPVAAPPAPWGAAD